MKTNQCLSHLKKLQFLGFLIDTEKNDCYINTREKRQTCRRAGFSKRIEVGVSIYKVGGELSA